MKNIFFLGLLLSSFLSFTQIREKGAIELTPIVGLSTSYHIHSALFGSSPVSDFQVGIYGNYFFNDRLSLRSGLLYQKMGSKKIDVAIFNNDYSEKTNYLTLPLVINFHFGDSKKWYVNYGISLGALINAKADYYDGNGFVDIKDLAKPMQFGLNGGIGYKFEISPEFVIVLDNSNMLGLTKTTEEKKGNNFYMSFNIGVVFKI